LAEADSKILEILVVEGEEGVYNAEYFAAEEHRNALDISGGKTEG
jgi:hypothetical protein